MSEPTFDTPPPSRPGQIAGVDTKWWIIGGGAAALIVWWAYKRSKNSATSGGANAGIDPATGLPYGSDGIDPNTGVPYSQESGYGTAAYAPAYGGGSATPVQTSTTVTVNEPPALTNADWYFKAERALVQHHVNRAHASGVLAKYLSMLPLDNEEVGIVEEAIRLVGPPPQQVPIHRVASRSKQRRR